MRPRKPALVFFGLSAINLLIFFFRDHFQYQPYASYGSLYGACDEDCLKKWTPLANDYPAAELAEAKQLTESIVQGVSDDREKAMLMAGWLREKFKGRLGRPNDDVLTASPLHQYKKLASSDSLQLWCGNFAQIFAYFCRAQEIPCRTVEIMQPGDRHVLNECYLRKEGSWVMMDLTNNLLFPISNSGRLLNFSNVRDSLRKGVALRIHRSSAQGPLAETLTPGAGIPSQYLGDHRVYYYHGINQDKVYTAWQKAVRYVSAQGSWYDILKDKKDSHLLFRLKQALLAAWALSFFVFLFSRAKFRP